MGSRAVMRPGTAEKTFPHNSPMEGRLASIRREIEETQVVAPVGGAGSRTLPQALVALLKEKFGEGILEELRSPKHLFKVGGKPIIDWFIEFYAGWGFEEFVLLVGREGDRIREYVGDGSRYGVEVRYSEDPPVRKVGKGKAIKNALLNGAIDRDKKALIAFPDDIILYDPAPLELVLKHAYWRERAGTVATVVLVPWIKSPYGVAEIEDGRVRAFREKPKIPIAVSTGVTLWEPEVYDYVIELVDIDAPHAVETESVVYPKLAEEGKMACMLLPSGDDWISVNSLKEWMKADRILSERRGQQRPAPRRSSG